MRLCTLPLLLLIASLGSPAHALKPCRIDGKIVYTRECIQQQQSEVSDNLHNLQQQAIADTERKPVSTSTVSLPVAERAATSPGNCPVELLFRAVEQDLSEPLMNCGDHRHLNQLVNREGRTLIHAAAYHGSERSLAYLLSKRVDIEPKSSTDHGATPLHLAAERNQSQLVLMLHRAGSDLESRDYLKRTALHRASRAGSMQAVRTLIRLRADVHATDRALNTPLLTASRLPGRAEILEALIDAGADINRRSRHDMTALHHAITTDTRATATLLSHDIDLDARDSEGRTALLLAATRDIDKHWPRIKQVIEARADLNAKDKAGNTLLKIAYHQQHEKLLKLLLRHGVDSRNVTTIIRKFESSNERAL